MAEFTPQSTDAAQRERAAFIAEAALDKKAEHLVALDGHPPPAMCPTHV